MQWLAVAHFVYINRVENTVPNALYIFNWSSEFFTDDPLYSWNSKWALLDLDMTTAELEIGQLFAKFLYVEADDAFLEISAPIIFISAML